MTTITDQIETLDQLAADCWQTSEDHGWHKPREIEGVVRNASSSERISLIHSELSEALEEMREGRFNRWYNDARDGKPEGVVTELADAVIRIMDLAIEIQNVHPEVPSIGEAIVEKMDFNNGRSFRHGGKVL